jgi:hypothetical protein
LKTKMNKRKIGGLGGKPRPPATVDGSREHFYYRTPISFVKVFLSHCDNFCHFLTILTSSVFWVYQHLHVKHRMATSFTFLLDDVRTRINSFFAGFLVWSTNMDMNRQLITVKQDCKPKNGKGLHPCKTVLMITIF